MEAGAIFGLIIGVGIVAAIWFAIQLVFALPDLRDRLGNWLYHSGKSDVFDKILYTPVWLILCVLSVFSQIIAGWLLLSAARDVKKWWHKR